MTDPLPRLLIVEDEAIIAMDMHAAIEELGFQVALASSCAQARDIFNADPGALYGVITDIRLADGSGDDLIDEFRVVRPDLPIVICTGYAPETMRGDTPVVEKPCDPKALIRAMELHRRSSD